MDCLVVEVVVGEVGEVGGVGALYPGREQPDLATMAEGHVIGSKSTLLSLLILSTLCLFLFCFWGGERGGGGRGWDGGKEEEGERD